MSDESDSDLDDFIDNDEEGVDDGHEYNSDEAVDEEKEKKSRKRHGGFILEEAEDVSDEEDEDSEDGEAGYKEMEEMLKRSEAFENERYSKKKSRIDYAIQDADHDELEEIAKNWAGSHYENENTIDKSIVMAPTSIYKKRLLPTVNDPNLWMVKCQIGEEFNAVSALMRKYNYHQKINDPLNILSAVQQNGIKGYIYIESYKQSYVKKAIQGLSYFMYGQNKQSMVPLEEMPDVLKVVKESVIIEPDSWVRIKRGEYRDDLARVVSVDRIKNSTLLMIVPRIDYFKAGTERKSVIRPPAALFDAAKANSNEDTQTIKDTSGFLVFRGNRFKDGFLYKTFPIKALQINGVEPKISEIELFNIESSSIKLNKKSDMDPSSNENKFRIGELVQVKTGELAKLIGHILSFSNDSVVIKPHHDVLKDSIELTSDNIQRHFNVGDQVVVHSGAHEGECGMVVRVEDPYVLVYSKETLTEMKIFINNLRKSTNRFSGVDASGKFQVGDFVKVDSTTIGYILKVQKDSVEVLNQLGKINVCKVQSLQKYVPRRGIFRDKNNNSLVVGATVRVDDVENIKGVVGQVKMLVREYAFVYSGSVRKERGIFTCKTRNLVVESFNKEIENNLEEKLNAKNIVQMSPRLSSESADVVIPRTAFGRNALFGKNAGAKNDMKNSMKQLKGKSVRVIRGTYKGYFGIVKDLTPEIVRVELHTNNKTISVPISQIAISGEDQPAFAKTHTAANTAINTPNAHNFMTPSSLASKTPQRSSSVYSYGLETPGNQTPGRSIPGGMTPHYDAQRTPMVYAETPSILNSSEPYMYDDSVSDYSASNSVYQLRSPGESSVLSYGSSALKPQLELGFVVNIHGSSSHQHGSSLMTGIVTKINGEMITVKLYGSEKVIEVDSADVTCVAPKINERAYIMSGQYYGMHGIVKTMLDNKCIIEISESADPITKPLDTLVKYGG